jgi:nucleotide-binding universal stress UspA family protein
VALDFAARLARQGGASLHVLHADDPLLAAAASASGVDLSSETRDELHRVVESTIRPGDTPIHYHVVTGAGAPTICHVASRERVDLIVMGMHGMSGAARATFGSTTEGVLQKAGTSVLVVPDTWEPPGRDRDDLSGMGPVVVGLECSEPAIGAASAGCRLAALLGTSVELRHIVPAVPVIQRWRGHADTVMTQGIEQARRELSAIVPALGASVPVSLQVESGQVAEAIARAVALEGPSRLLVLGRRNRRSHLGGPGSTAYRVLTLASVPVLVYLPEP